MHQHDDDDETRGDGRLTLRKRGGIMTITVQRPEVRNALDVETISAFASVVEDLERDVATHIVILTGAGDRAFIAGGDLQQLSQLSGEVGGRALSTAMGEPLLRFAQLPQITCAAINGDAYGGGVEVALACDLRIMDRSATLALTQGRFGVTTGWGGARHLVERVGYARALELLLTQRRITATECLNLNLITRLADQGGALDDALMLARQLIRAPGAWLRGLKRVVRAAAEEDADEAIATERDVFGRLWASDHHEQTVRAFLASRNTPKPPPEDD